MSKQCLNIEQMQHLKELGVDTNKAYMSWIVDESMKYKPFISLSSDAIDHVDETTCAIPTFTLQDILDLLPSEIQENSECNVLSINNFSETWSICYELSDEFEPLILFESKELIDAAYEMLCWCIENGYVKTNKED